MTTVASDNRRRWREARLGEMGLTYTGLAGKTKADFDREDGVPYVPYLNVFENAIVDPTKLGRVRVAPGERQNRVRRGDVLFTASSETPEDVGTASVVGHDIPDLCLNSFCFGYRMSSDNRVAFEFLAYLFRGPQLRRSLYRLAQGATRYNLSKRHLMEVVVRLPPVGEQRRIAAFLTTWDRAIDSAEQRLGTARNRKHGLMRALLTGEARFSEFDGQPWRQVRLGEMGNVHAGGTPASGTPAYWNGGIPWATPTDITNLQARDIRSTARTISEAGLRESSAKLLPEQTLLICTRATIGEIAIAAVPMATNQGFKNLVLSGDYDPRFVYYLISFFKNCLLRVASGSTFGEVSKRDVERMSFKVPSLPEQRRIAAVLDTADTEIALHLDLIAHLRAQKRSLLEQLLTCKLRLPPRAYTDLDSAADWPPTPTTPPP